MKSKGQKYDDIFFSPHLDDAILSCGGLIAQKTAGQKKVLVVTLFGGRQTEKISRGAIDFIKKSGCLTAKELNWKRREEDKKAVEKLGAHFLHLSLVEAGFRTDDRGELVYPDYDIFGPKIDEAGVKQILVAEIKKIGLTYLKTGGSLYFPLGLGGHVDHLVVEEVGEALAKKYRVRFWEDYPYLSYHRAQQQLLTLENNFKLSQVVYLNDIEYGQKKEAIECYQSQLDGLFADKPMFISKRENYFSKKKLATRKQTKLWFITDEIENGGARRANDSLIKSLYDQTKEVDDLKVYEQIAPVFRNSFKVTKKLFWSIANFERYFFRRRKVWPEAIISTCPEALFSFWLAKKMWWRGKKIKLFYYCNSDRNIGVTLYKGKSKWKKILYSYLFSIVERLAIGEVTMVITASVGHRAKLVDKYLAWGAKPAIKVVTYGIDDEYLKVSRLKEKAVAKTGNRAKTIMYSGRLDPAKGVDKLIQSLKYLSKRGGIKINLIIATFRPVARDAYYVFLKKLGQKMSDKKIQVRFIFSQNIFELIGLYRSVECVVLASESENSPLVFFEALACGTIFIGSKTGNMPEVLSKIDSQLLLENTNPAEIADKIGYVFSLSREKRRKLAAKGKKICRNYSWKNTAIQIWSLVAD